MKTRLKLERERAARDQENENKLKSIAQSVSKLSDSVATQRPSEYYLGNMLSFMLNEMKEDEKPDMKVFGKNKDVFVAIWTSLVVDGTGKRKSKSP